MQSRCSLTPGKLQSNRNPPPFPGRPAKSGLSKRNQEKPAELLRALPVFVIARHYRYAQTIQIEAQRSGFDLGRRSNEAIRSFQAAPKGPPGNGASAVCSDVVPLTGIEPVRFAPRDFKSLVSASSTTAAYRIFVILPSARYPVKCRAAEFPLPPHFSSQFVHPFY